MCVCGCVVFLCVSRMGRICWNVDDIMIVYEVYEIFCRIWSIWIWLNDDLPFVLFSFLRFPGILRFRLIGFHSQRWDFMQDILVVAVENDWKIWLWSAILLLNVPKRLILEHLAAFSNHLAFMQLSFRFASLADFGLYNILWYYRSHKHSSASVINFDDE